MNIIERIETQLKKIEEKALPAKFRGSSKDLDKILTDFSKNVKDMDTPMKMLAKKGIKKDQAKDLLMRMAKEMKGLRQPGDMDAVIDDFTRELM